MTTIKKKFSVELRRVVITSLSRKPKLNMNKPTPEELRIWKVKHELWLKHFVREVELLVADWLKGKLVDHKDNGKIQ